MLPNYLKRRLQRDVHCGNRNDCLKCGIIPVDTLVALVLLLSVICPGSSYKYLGCYEDRRAAADRDLAGSLFLEDQMSPAICERKCGSHSFTVFGLQYGTECWCGDAYGKYAKLGDGDCNKPCTADHDVMCGADLKNSVYSVDKELIKASSKAAQDGRPLLALVMIVKDEAHTLASTLLPLKPYIDTYFILDTGSTDGTQNLIKTTLSGVNGVVAEEPFVDYGTSRNRILDIAAQAANPPVFCLMLSADETVYNAASLREFVEKHRNSQGPMHEAYPLVMDVGWKFDSVRLSRTDAKWRYVGRVHEYLAPPDGGYRDTLRVPDVYIKFHITDPERRQQREHTILRILLEEKQKNPSDARTSFYIARTLNAIGNHTAAYNEFKRRVSLGGWKEEVYESLFAMAWQLKELDRPWSEIQQHFLDAHNHSPDRAEPIYNIADYYMVNGHLATAYMFGHRCLDIPYPKHAALWVLEDVYTWQCRYVVGMVADSPHVNKLKEGARALIEALKVQPDDMRMVNKLKEYQTKMSAEDWESVQDAHYNEHGRPHEAEAHQKPEPGQISKQVPSPPSPAPQTHHPSQDVIAAARRYKAAADGYLKPYEHAIGLMTFAFVCVFAAFFGFVVVYFLLERCFGRGEVRRMDALKRV